MQTTTKLKGNEDEDDKSKVVKDGESIRTSMLLMDSVQREVITHTVPQDALDQHRPGFVRLGDADTQRRASLYAEHDRRLNDAWKAASSGPATVKEPTPIKVVDYASYDRRVSEAWRGGA